MKSLARPVLARPGPARAGAGLRARAALGGPDPARPDGRRCGLAAAGQRPQVPGAVHRCGEAARRRQSSPTAAAGARTTSCTECCARSWRSRATPRCRSSCRCWAAAPRSATTSLPIRMPPSASSWRPSSCRDKGYKNIAIVSHSLGATMANQYLINANDKTPSRPGCSSASSMAWRRCSASRSRCWTSTAARTGRSRRSAPTSARSRSTSRRLGADQGAGRPALLRGPGGRAGADRRGFLDRVFHNGDAAAASRGSGHGRPALQPAQKLLAGRGRSTA